MGAPPQSSFPGAGSGAGGAGNAPGSMSIQVRQSLLLQQRQKAMRELHKQQQLHQQEQQRRRLLLQQRQQFTPQFPGQPPPFPQVTDTSYIHAKYLPYRNTKCTLN